MNPGIRQRLYLFVIVCTLGACSTTAKPGPSAGLSGAWRSEGYGLVLVADDATLQTYEVTRTTCVRAAKLTRREESVAGVEAVYADGDEVVLVKAAAEPGTRRVHREGSASDMVFHRIDGLPAACTAPTPDTPEGNFEVFAQTWAEHYILFDEKGADWSATVATARAKVTPATNPEALYEVLEGMIAPLEDAHTPIQADSIKRRYQGFRRGTDRLLGRGMADFKVKVMLPFLAVIDGKLQGPMRKWCNDQVQYGRLDDSTGYLRILSEDGYTGQGDFASGLIALEEALDAIFAEPGLEALVLDVRINFGGADPYGLALASRLATSDYVAYSKEARSDPVDRTKWTPGQPSLVRPSARPRFKGPVVELIGPLTISAGETLTQALMGRTPRVTRIGENTQGVFSDILFRTLPNGWHFGLPNEVFRSPGGKTFDGAGIPPDISVPVFAEQDLAAGRDPGLERAMTELRRDR